MSGLSARLDRWFPWLLVIVVGVVFGQAVRFEFVHWDDHTYVFANPYLNPPSLAGIRHLWTTGYLGIYAPATFTVHGLHALLLGFNAARFHLASLLVHAANVVLVYLLLRQLLTRRKAGSAPLLAACGALLFAVHPLRAEPVGWVTGMKELLATFFALLAMHAYFGAARSPRWLDRFWPRGTIWFILAVLSKPTMVMLGPFVAVLDLALLRTPWRTALRGPWLWYAIVVPVVFFARRLQPTAMWTEVPAVWLRPFVAADAIQFYLIKLLVPLDLTSEYGRTPQWLLESGAWRVSWIGPAVLAAGAGWAAWRRRLAPLGLLTAFVVALGPLLGFIPFLTQQWSTVADHYMYFPFLIISLAVSLALAEVPPGRQVAAVAITLVVGAACAALTFAQLPVWRNDDALFPYAIARSPRSTILHMNYGESLFKRGRYQESLDEFQAAAAIKPHADFYNNIGSALVMLQRYDEAEAAFEQGLALDPTSKSLQENLTRLRQARGGQMQR